MKKWDDEGRHVSALWKKGRVGGLFERSLFVTLEEEERTKRVVGRFRRRRSAPCTDENKRKKAASRVKHAFRLDWE